MKYLILIFCLFSLRIDAQPKVLSSKNTAFQRKDDILFYQNKPFTGTIEDKKAGKIIFKESYLNGKQDGESIQWYLNGQMAEKRIFKENRKEGKHLGWWEDGKLRFEYFFNKDMPIKHHREWYPNGQLFTSFHYNSSGQPEGSQQMWFDNGKIRANYVVKNGRRYGLYGSKGCMGENEKKETKLKISKK
jgi:antitoxin component YwqK of YwqJK toxin-antitoxin module